MTHRMGIIGLGTVGSRFVEQFGRHPDFELVAAWDPDPEARAANAAGGTIVDSAAAVIDASEAVYVAVPPLFHREYVEACLDAGVGVFCEKPLGVDVDESRALVHAVESSGLPAGVNFVFSAAPAAQQVLEMVESGVLGNVERGELRLHFAEWPRAWHARAQWLRQRDQGGWIREVVSHFLFLAGRAFGSLTLDAAQVAFPDGADGATCEVDATARFTTPGGVPVVMSGTSGGVGPDVVDFTIRGDVRSVRLWDWYHVHSTDGGEWLDMGETDRAALGAAAYSAQLDELRRLLSGETSTIATFTEALAVQELVEAMLAGDAAPG